MNDVEKLAKSVGLHVDTYSPGDGVTRYRFFTDPSDYFASNGVYTALGKKEAITFLQGVFVAITKKL